jgi:FixJ family two-component response regulator
MDYKFASYEETSLGTVKVEHKDGTQGVTQADGHVYQVNQSAINRKVIAEGKERFEEYKRLNDLGLDNEMIANKLGVSVRTVQRYAFMRRHNGLKQDVSAIANQIG